MTSHPSFQTFNDHLMVCPAGPLCDAYFGVVEHVIDLCTAHGAKDIKLKWPYQSYWVNEMNRIAREAAGDSRRSEGIKLFAHAYTLARSDGPDCARLTCNRRNSFATGCVAPHLVRYVEECERLRTSWRNTTTLS